MAGDQERVALEPLVLERLAQAIERDARVRGEIGGIVGKVDVQIDRTGGLLRRAAAHRDAALQGARVRLAAIGGEGADDILLRRIFRGLLRAPRGRVQGKGRAKNRGYRFHGYLALVCNILTVAATSRSGRSGDGL